MASKQNKRQRLREERLAAEREAAAGARRRLLIGYAVAAVLGLGLAVALVVAFTSSGGAGDGEIPENAFIELGSGVTNDVEPDGREGTPPPALEQGDLATAAQMAGCTVETDLPDEGNRHVQTPPEYETNPATSGDHVPPPDYQADGAYSEPVDPFLYVHAHEHARVTIHYSPELSEADQLALKGVFDEDPSAVLLFPDPDIPGEVAASSWSALMNCESFDGGATLDAVRDFRDEFRGAYNPERIPLQF